MDMPRKDREDRLADAEAVELRQRKYLTRAEYFALANRLRVSTVQRILKEKKENVGPDTKVERVDTDRR